MTESKSTIELSRERESPEPPVSAAPATDTVDTADGKRARLTPDELLLRRRTAQGSYVFDLRDVEAFRDGHIPGAYNLPYEVLESNLHRMPFSGDLMFYDGGEGSAAQAIKQLQDNGFGDSSYIEEGYEALKSALEQAPEEVQYERMSSDERKIAIEKVLDERIREFLARDGGGLDVKSIEDDRILVAYFGACGGCGSSTAGTLRFIQTTLTVALNHEIEVVPVEEGEAHSH
jgi:Fe-S cluster biogenesis protein NfuA/rhodanese-related sulfurtransferase